MNKEQKLNNLLEVWNGGPGSGNHAPGQGKGVGKPGNGSSSSQKFTTSKDGKVVRMTSKSQYEALGKLKGAQEYRDSGGEKYIIYTNPENKKFAATEISGRVKVDSDSAAGALPKIERSLAHKIIDRKTGKTKKSPRASKEIIEEIKISDKKYDDYSGKTYDVIVRDFESGKKTTFEGVIPGKTITSREK